MTYLILALIGIVAYLVFRRPADVIPQGTGKSDVTTTRDTNPDTSGKVVTVDGDNNPVVVDPVSKNYLPPAPKDPIDRTAPIPSTVPGGTVIQTPTGQFVPTVSVRNGAVPIGDPVIRTDPGAPAGRRVITTTAGNAFRAEAGGIAVYEPDTYKGMRSFFLTSSTRWMTSEESKQIYGLMYGSHYLNLLEVQGKVAENMNPAYVVYHRRIQPQDRKAQLFIYDGNGNEVIWDEHIQKVVYPAA